MLGIEMNVTLPKSDLFTRFQVKLYTKCSDSFKRHIIFIYICAIFWQFLMTIIMLLFSYSFLKRSYACTRSVLIFDLFLNAVNLALTISNVSLSYSLAWHRREPYSVNNVEEPLIERTYNNGALNKITKNDVDLDVNQITEKTKLLMGNKARVLLLRRQDGIIENLISSQCHAPELPYIDRFKGISIGSFCIIMCSCGIVSSIILYSNFCSKEYE